MRFLRFARVLKRDYPLVYDYLLVDSVDQEKQNVLEQPRAYFKAKAVRNVHLLNNKKFCKLIGVSVNEFTLEWRGRDPLRSEVILNLRYGFLIRYLKENENKLWFNLL